MSDKPPVTIEEAQERFRANNLVAAAAREAAEAERHAAPKRARPTRSADASRWATLNSFVDVAMGDLSRAELAVWLVLFRDVRDGTARTGMTDIARRAGCHRGSVVRAVQSLQARGLIRLVRRGRKNGGTSVYAVCGVPAPKTGRHPR